MVNIRTPSREQSEVIDILPAPPDVDDVMEGLLGTYAGSIKDYLAAYGIDPLQPVRLADITWSEDLRQLMRVIFGDSGIDRETFERDLSLLQVRRRLPLQSFLRALCAAALKTWALDSDSPYAGLQELEIEENSFMWFYCRQHIQHAHSRMDIAHALGGLEGSTELEGFEAHHRVLQAARKEYVQQQMENLDPLAHTMMNRLIPLLCQFVVAPAQKVWGGRNTNQNRPRPRLRHHEQAGRSPGRFPLAASSGLALSDLVLQDRIKQAFLNAMTWRCETNAAYDVKIRCDMPTPGVAFDSEIHVEDEFPVGPGVGCVPDPPPNSSVYVTRCPGVHIQKRQRYELPLGREKIYSRAIVFTIPANVPNDPFRQAEGAEGADGAEGVEGAEHGGENNAEMQQISTICYDPKKQICLIYNINLSLSFRAYLLYQRSHECLKQSFSNPQTSR